MKAVLLVKALTGLFRNVIRRPMTLVVLGGLLYGTLFFYLNILKFQSFFSFEWEDDAAQHQVVFNIANSFWPQQTIYPCQLFFGHFKPILFLVALFYKIHAHIYTWFFLMIFSYGLCVCLVFILARDVLGDKISALLVSAVYLLYPPLHFATLGALDANNFALPLFFMVIYFMHKKQWGAYCVSTILAGLCKEDIPFIILLLGIYQLKNRYPTRWWLTTLVYAVLYGIFAVVMSSFCWLAGDVSSKEQALFFHMDGDSISKLFQFYFLNGAEGVKSLFDITHIRVFAMLLFPLLFLSLLSCLFLVPAVMYVEILIKTPFPNHDSYYLAPVIPFLFAAFIYSLNKIQSNYQRNCLLVVSLTICIFGLFSRNIVGHLAAEPSRGRIMDERFLGVSSLFDKRIYSVDDEDRLAWDFIRMIPDRAAVTASGDLLPALGSRRELYEFALNHPSAENRRSYSYKEYPAYDSEYVLVNSKVLTNGLSGHYAFLNKNDLEEEVRRLITDHGYKMLRREGNFILLKKVGR